MRLILTLMFALLIAPGFAFAEDDLSQENIDHVMQERAHKMKHQLLEKGPYFSLKGEVKHLSGNSYTVNGETFQLEDSTRVEGKLSNGSYASVHGSISGNKKIAQVVRVSERANAKGGTSSLVDRLGDIGSRPVTPAQ